MEQFDVQAPQLTVRETVLYSARLRLDSNNSAVSSDEDKVKFVDEVLHTLELEPLADCLVGDSLDGGLSFEQRKRLSIAVELAASPSIIFLDEVSVNCCPYGLRVALVSPSNLTRSSFFPSAYVWIGGTCSFTCN